MVSYCEVARDAFSLFEQFPVSAGLKNCFQGLFLLSLFFETLVVIVLYLYLIPSQYQF